jgi:hypothetical protein
VSSVNEEPHEPSSVRTPPTSPDAEDGPRPATAWQRSTHARWPWLRTALGAILLLGGLLFMARVLHGQFADFTAVAVSIPGWTYPVLTLLATITVLITAALHAVVVAGMTSASVDPARVRYAYAASQVARYVPGKVFGVILETQMLAPAMSLRQVVAATLIQTLLIYAWAGIVSIIVLAALAAGSAWLIMLAPPSLAVLWLAQRNRWLERLRAALTSRVDSSAALVISTDLSRRSAWTGTLLLAVQWLPFFVIWIILASPTHGLAAAFWLGASYLLASIGGSLLVLLPSGLVVREAAFVWLGALYGLPAPSLMAWAIVVRIALTLADVLAMPLLWAALRARVRR